MNICLLSRTSAYANGGTAAYVRFLGEALRQRGHSMRSVARFFQQEPTVTCYAAIDETPTTVRQAEVERLATGIPLELIAPTGGAARLPLSRLASLLSRSATQSTGIALFNHAYEKPLAAAIPADTDAIHYTGNGWEMLGFTALAEARRRGIPFTVTPFVHPGTWGDSPLDARLYDQADAVFVCSQNESDWLAARDVRADVMHRTGLGPASTMNGDRARFRAAHQLGDRPLILFIGRRERYKGYHALCTAMEDIRRAVPDVCLVAIGPAAEPPFPEVAPEALLDLGMIPNDSHEKPDALAACDLFCMPSEAESFGIVYVEAWANAMPVIGGMSPAVRELIEEGVTGYCVSQDPTQIADAAVRLLKNPALRQRMGSAGRALQQKRYSWDRVAEGHEQVFQQMRQKHTKKQFTN